MTVRVACAFVAISALAFAGCPRPMLWLGEAAQDGGSSSGAAGTDAEPLDAGTTKMPEPPVAAPPSGPSEAGSPPQPPPAPPAPPPAKVNPTATPDAGAKPDVEADAGEEPEAMREPVPALPKGAGRCPTLSGPGMYTFGDPRSRTLSVRIFIAPDARSKPEPGGPLILYWHALGSSQQEVLEGLGQAAIDDVVARGGVVASFESKLCATCAVGELAWYSIDDAVSDQVVACAVEQARIDPRRVHSMGFSAGGLHSMHLALARSSYLASVVAYSGSGTDLTPEQNQDPSYKVPSLHVFGSAALDILEINFNALSRQWDEMYRKLGWYSLFCEHSGGHVIPTNFGPLAYRFLLDHPYRVAPEPYTAMIPSAFPVYCRNAPMPR